MTDEQLLSQYCTDRSESAFAELVDRHLGWVRGVAARGLGADSSLVDDVSQAVFIALAKKARSLNGRLPLSGWLFRATRYTVAHVRRAEQRRKKHEQEAKPMSEGTIDAKWLELAPLLDELMAALSEQDRRVVLSRFYSQKTFAEVGSEIGVSEEAARARVNRAVEKLRSMFARRGVTTPAVAALSALIVDHVIVPTSTAHAAAAVHAVFHPSSLSKAQTIAKQTLRGISISRLAPVAVMLAVIAMTVGIFIVGHFHARQRSVPIAQQLPTPVASTVIATTPPPPVTRETDAPGDTDLARWDVMLTPDGGDAIEAVCEPIQTNSKMYEGMIVDANVLRHAVMAAEAAGQVASYPDYMHINGHWTGKPDDPIELQGPIQFMYPMNATLMMMQDLAPATETATPTDKNHLHLVISAGPTERLIISEGPREHLNQRWVRGAKVQYDGVLEAGQAVAFMASIQAASGKVYSHLIVWETFKATAKQFWPIEGQRDPRFWIHTGPAKIRDWLNAADFWSAKAPKAEAMVDPRFTRTLSDGKVLRIVALANFNDRPFCWWNPLDGKPVAFDSCFEMHGGSSDGLVLAVEQTADEAISHREQPPCSPNQWFEGYLQHVIGDRDTAVDIGVSVGEWKSVADIKPGETVHVGQAIYHLDKNKDDWQRTGVVDDQEEIVSAVRPDGKEQCQTMARPIVIRQIADKPPASASGMLGMPSELVSFARLWYRKREWVRFEGFANQPVVDDRIGGK